MLWLRGIMVASRKRRRRPAAVFVPIKKARAPLTSGASSGSRHEFHDPQYGVDTRTLPSNVRGRRGDHVFRNRLRIVAADTGKPLRSKRLARWQRWLWFWGMMITSIPGHITGLMGQPRRVALLPPNFNAATRHAASTGRTRLAISAPCSRSI